MEVTKPKSLHEKFQHKVEPVTGNNTMDKPQKLSQPSNLQVIDRHDFKKSDPKNEPLTGNKPQDFNSPKTDFKEIDKAASNDFLKTYKGSGSGTVPPVLHSYVVEKGDSFRSAPCIKNDQKILECHYCKKIFRGQEILKTHVIEHLTGQIN